MLPVLKANIIILFSSLIISVLSSHGPVSAQRSPAYVFTGEFRIDHFGESVASAGDVNNDGFDDIIVGAPANDAGGSSAGRAYVFSGRTGDTLYVFTGEAIRDHFGTSVASAGDVNNDGYDDLIVGAPFNASTGRSTGRCYVYSGLNGNVMYIFTGERAHDNFGFSVATAGDVNGDGYDDVIVGAYLHDGSGRPGDPAENTGRAYVYSGRFGNLIHEFSGEETGNGFGASVASAGDVNGDGYDDLIIGAFANGAGGAQAGRAYVHSGVDGELLYVFTGEAVRDRLGASVASAGDVNADGYADLIVGAYRNDAGGEDAGRAYVYSGLTGDTLYVFSGEATGDEFGIPVASAGDVNGDGHDDLIIGGRSNGAIGARAGRAYIYSGIDGVTLRVLTGEVAGDRLGISVASAGDVDNDGYDDLIVGATGNDAGGEDAGRAYVYLGRPSAVVHLDIKPGSCPNPLSIRGRDSKSKAILPVALLGTEDFDVRDIDVSSLTFEGVSPFRHNFAEVSAPPEVIVECGCVEESSDGYEDLILKFYRSEIIDVLGDLHGVSELQLTLKGRLGDGEEFTARDCIVIRPKEGAGSGPIDGAGIPDDFTLIGNYPNPFNPVTKINFGLPKASHVTIDVYNILGQKVVTLLNERRPAGYHSVSWYASDASSGVYLYILKADGFSDKRKMLLLK